MKQILGVVILAIATLIPSVRAAGEYQAAELIDAVRAADQSRVKALLARGADPNTHGAEGITPLLVAASMGSTEIARALLAKGAEVNAQDSTSWQLAPLMVASFSGHLDMIKLLLDKGADIELKNRNGDTALFFASQAKDHMPVVNLLQERGAKKLPAKSGNDLFFSIAGLPPNSRCFEHIEGPRCSNAAPKKNL